MGYSVATNRILKNLRNDFLTDQIGEPLWSQFAGKNNVDMLVGELRG